MEYYVSARQERAHLETFAFDVRRYLVRRYHFIQRNSSSPNQPNSAEFSRMFSRIQREIDAMAGQFAFEIKFGFLIINIRKWHKHFDKTTVVQRRMRSSQFLQPIRTQRDFSDWPNEPSVPAGLLFGARWRGKPRLARNIRITAPRFARTLSE